MGGQNAKAYNARLGVSNVAGQQPTGESVRRKVFGHYIKFANGVGEKAISLLKPNVGNNIDADGVEAAVSYNVVDYCEDLRLDVLDEMMTGNTARYETFKDGVKCPGINRNTALYVWSYLHDNMEWEPAHEEFVKMMFSNSGRFSNEKNKAGYYSQMIKNAFAILKSEIIDQDFNKFLKHAEKVLSYPKSDQEYITATAFNCLLGVATFVTYKADFEIFKKLRGSNFDVPVSIEWQGTQPDGIVLPTSQDTRYRDYPPYYADTSDNNEFLTKVRCGVIWDNMSRYVRAVNSLKAASGGGECHCSAGCKCMEQTGKCECVECHCDVESVAGGCGPCQDRMFGGAEQNLDFTMGILILACVLLIGVLFDIISDGRMAYIAVLLVLGVSGFMVLDKIFK